MKTRYLIICLEMCFQVFSKIFFFFASSAERQVMVDFQGVTYMKLEDDSIFLSLSKSKLYFLKTLLVPKCFLKGFFAQSKKFLKWNINHLWGKKKNKLLCLCLFTDLDKSPAELFQMFQTGMFNISQGRLQHGDQWLNRK